MRRATRRLGSHAASGSAGPPPRLRRHARVTPGGAFLNINVDVLELVLHHVFETVAHGKAKLATVCKTLYNRHRVDVAKGRVAHLMKRSNSNSDDCDCALLGPARDPNTGQAFNVWLYESEPYRLTLHKEQTAREECPYTRSGEWHFPVITDATHCPIGHDAVRVLVVNPRTTTQTKRRRCMGNSHFSHPQSIYTSVFGIQLTMKSFASKADADRVKLADASEAQDLKEFNCATANFLCSKLPFEPRACKVVQTTANHHLWPAHNQERHEEVPGVQQLQIVALRRAVHSFDIVLEAKGPGVVVRLTGTLDIKYAEDLFADYQLVQKRIVREERAERELMHWCKEKHGCTFRALPEGNYVMGFSHAKFAKYAAETTGITPFEELEGDVFCNNKEKQAQEYWNATWRRFDRGERGINFPAMIEWTDIEYKCMLPRQLSNVKVNGAALTKYVDAYTRVAGCEVTLALVPLVETLAAQVPDSDSDSDSDSE